MKDTAFMTNIYARQSHIYFDLQIEHIDFGLPLAHTKAPKLAFD